MNKNNLKDNKLLQNNPLIANDFTFIVNEMQDNKSYKPDKDGVLLPKIYYFEREKNTKIYKTPTHRKLIGLLSNNAKCLLYWIFFEIETNKDYVLINKDRYLKENNIKSIKTYKQALTELQVNLIICAAPVKDVYFINPRLFFSGSRIKTYPNNITIYKPNKIPK